MSKKRTTWIALLLVLGQFLSVPVGCGKNIPADKYSTTVVATYGDEKIYLDEVNFLAKQEQYLMESYYSYLMGGEDFWNYDLGNGTTIAETTKTGVMSRVHQTHVLCAAAAELGISLTEEDQAKIQEAVNDFKENTQPEAFEKMNATDELLVSVYTQNALANRVWEYLVKDIDTEVDYEENRQITVSYLNIDRTAAEEEEESKAADETKSEDETPYEDTDEYAEMEELMKTVIEDLKSGVTMDDERTKLAEDSTLKVTKSSDTFGNDEHDDAFGETARSLSTGEYGYVYVEEDGWYVIFCDTDNDEEATQNKIDSVLNNRRADMFKEKYAELPALAVEFKVDESVWAVVNYEESLYVIPETTASDETETESESETAAK